MGFNDIPAFLGVKRKAVPGKHKSYGVTPLGKEKAEQLALSGPRFKVLDYVSEQGPCGMDEIARECGMSGEKVKVVLTQLMNDGYVQPVSQGA